MGLEPYQERYTLQLTAWNTAVFESRNIDYVVVPGTTLDTTQKIITGQVLDAHGRSYFGMSQMMNLVKLMQSGEVTSDDVIYFEDMFQPGIESLPYIINQVQKEHRPRIYVRCLAQTIDPDDFVHVWDMQQWMMKYEQMLDQFVDGVLASSEEMVAHMKIAGWTAPIYNISGLAFGKKEVQSRVPIAKKFKDRSMRVSFSARWDQEKQPHFYMDLIEEWYKRYPITVEFALLTGSSLKSNDDSCIQRARQLQKSGKLVIYENLNKNAYYEILNDTRVLFNCALQDWISNTVSEADALGSNVLFPAYRSFPEVFSNDAERLYIPWSMEDAIQKMLNLLTDQHKNSGKISDYTDKTIDRVCDILSGNGEHLLRESKDYRKHVRENKF